MRARALAALGIAGAASCLLPVARAQSVRTRQPAATVQAPSAATPAASGTIPGLRAHFGLDAAVRLMRSADPDERLRGLERAATIHTPEALALLERAASAAAPGGFDPRAPTEGVARRDPRALLVVVRGLAAWADHESAREALAEILSAATHSMSTQLATSSDPAMQEVVGLSRVRLAREEAAIALARSGHPLALEALLSAARSGGPAQEPALQALASFPPATGLFGGVALTTPGTIALAVGTGDLRALDSVEGVLAASDPGVRAAAFAALGTAGDARVAPAAREALRDRNRAVRVASAEALVRLGTADAGQAVEGLVADDETALDGLRLARSVQTAGVTRAVAARAAASADDLTRVTAVEALGRQSDALAVEALVALVEDPPLAGDAADALARSPSLAALPALERLASLSGKRRLAMRAYFVRRSVRGERSRALDSLPGALAASADPLDRALSAQVRVALGERTLASGLGDPDVRVQRAAAMGALALSPAERDRACSAGLPPVHDDAAQQVLSFLAGEADDGSIPTRELLERARAGGADAPPCAMALARRGDDDLASQIDALLASPDPVLRAEVARGLGGSHSPDATGRLARAYLFEPAVDVRRALVQALAARTVDAGAPERQGALSLAASLDPDRVTRDTAARAQAGLAPAGSNALREVAWVRLVAAAGAALPAATTATLTGADGITRPVVFDDEGYALVGGLPPGEARVRLASRVTAYESP